MSGRSLRRREPRASAKVNYNDADFDDSEEDLQPPRKRPTRASARLTAGSRLKELDFDASSAAPESEGDDMDVDIEVGGGVGGGGGQGTTGAPSTSASADDEDNTKPSAARKVRLKLSKAKLPPTPDEDDDEEEADAEGEGEGEGEPSGAPTPDEEDEIGDEEDEEEEEAEGEGEDEIDSDDEDDGGRPSAATSNAGGTSRVAPPMTARQAAMAGLGGGDAQLLSLDQIDASRRKGPAKTAEEIEDKRREAAKRRKQLLQQKVKEEKEGAVDRLLNKQAPRPRAKRNMSGMMPASLAPSGLATPTKGVLGGRDTRSTSPDGDGTGSTDSGAPAVVVPPATMFRWVSSARGPPAITEVVNGKVNGDAGTEKDQQKPKPIPTDPESHLSFALSIPSDILSQLQITTTTPPPEPSRPRPTSCGAPGCSAPWKYRVPGEDPEKVKGACGLEHFRLLKAS